MRVVATCVPGVGHLIPMMPLLTALRDDGHDVVVASGKPFGPAVESLGFAFEPAGMDWQESQTRQAFPDLVEALESSGALTVVERTAIIRPWFLDLLTRRVPPAFAADVVDLIGRFRADLVVHEPTEFGGPVAAEAAGVGHVMLLTGAAFWFEAVCPKLAGCDQARAVFGLSPRHGDPGWLLDGAVVGEPASWSAGRLDGDLVNWVSPAPAAQPRQNLEWLDELPRPLLLVTLGTVYNKQLGLFDPLARGAARHAASVVVTVGEDGDPEQLSGLPSHVHVRRYVPHDALLEHADGVLAHGGWGSLTGCAAAGVPLAALPLGADHDANVAIVERIGFGFALEPEGMNEARASEAAHRLLADDSLRANAARQRHLISHLPSPSATASILAKRYGSTKAG